MGFFSNFNDDDEDDFIDDFMDRFEDDDLEDFNFNWKGKTYNSVKILRRELSDEDLPKVLEHFDKQILKTEKALKMSRVKFVLFGAITLVGIGIMFSKGNVTGTLKNILDIYAPTSVGFGLSCMFMNNKKQKKVEDELYDLYFVYDELDDENIKRGNGSSEDFTVADIHDQSAEIFPDILG